jgi:hypothetical protein
VAVVVIVAMALWQTFHDDLRVTNLRWPARHTDTTLGAMLIPAGVVTRPSIEPWSRPDPRHRADDREDHANPYE